MEKPEKTMKRREWIKLMLKKTGVVGGPVLTTIALVGLSISLLQGLLINGFVWGLIAFAGSFWMLASSRFHHNEIYVDVSEVDN